MSIRELPVFVSWWEEKVADNAIQHRPRGRGGAGRWGADAWRLV